MIRRCIELVTRAVAVLRRRRLDREFDEELETHLALITETYERGGLPRPEARRRAILQMGGLDASRRLHRESRGLPRLERAAEAVQAIGKDLRHAARSLARARAFALVCVLSLGVGMGAFVALVTFLRAMTAPARGLDTNGLVELLVTPAGPLRAKLGVAALDVWSYPDFLTVRQADTGMTVTGWALGASTPGLPRPDETTPAQVLTLFVSANYFETLGAALARGPGFAADDDRPSAAPRAVLSHGFWRNRLASDPDIVGKTVAIDGTAHTVVGIAPEGFSGHFNALDDENPVLYLPLERHPRLRADPALRSNRALDWVHTHARLAPGVDVARARTALAAAMARVAREHPATNEFKTATVEAYFPHGAANRDQVFRVAGVLLTLAGAVLLIVCVNISGMMLVRGAVRERELSIREAVGASRWRLVQYLFFDAVWLAAAGGGLSVFVLFGIPAGIARWLGTTVPPEMDLDLTAVAICGGLCLAVSLAMGLLPAVRLSQPPLVPALKDDAGGGGLRVSRVQRTAAAMQVAVAVPFLVVSGVMLDRVRTADFGFVPEGLVAARVDPAGAGPDVGAVSLRTLRATLENAGGVRSVTAADGMPIDFTERTVRVSPSQTAAFASAQATRVAEGYLETLGVRLLRGRTITTEDRSAGARVVVVSEPLAERLFPGRDAVGEQITFAIEEGRDESFTIVGVTADFATAQLTTARPQLLLPLPDAPASPVYLIARGADEHGLTSAFEHMRREVGVTLLPNQLGVFAGVVTGTELVRKSLGDLVAESVAVGVAGAIVLLLASLGVLGVIAFMVATRTREIAVRMALGATRPHVFRLLLGDVVTLILPGVIVGLVGGAVLIRTMDNVMGTPLTVGPTPLGAVEPLIYAGAAAIAVAVALVAGLPAARRAASIQPMVAMRSE